MTTVRDLLSRGYLPKALPPSFTSISWGAAASRHSIQAPSGYPDTMLMLHAVARPTALPRILGIPHPAHFHSLSHLVATNWRQLQLLAQTSKISLTNPRIGDQASGERALEPELGFKSRPMLSLQRRRGCKVLLKSDIAQCYPSLYTHAISWAIQGRAAAQAAFRGRPAVRHYADLIDTAIRQGQEKQSVGIPIGPDTSFLLGEIVMSKLDESLTSRIGPLLGTRSIDDYELYFETRAEAEKARVELSHAAAEFRLNLNLAKTRILELPQPLEPHWKHVLSSYSFVGPIQQARKQLLAATDFAFEREPGSRSITYLLSMLARCTFKAGLWPLVQTIALACVELEENSISRAAKLFLNAAARRWRIDRPAITDLLNRIVLKYAPLRCGNPVAWALWLMARLGLQVSPLAAARAAAMEDAVVLTVLAHASSLGLTPTFQLDQLAIRKNTHHCWHGSDWLFLYECVQHGWLGAAAHRNVERGLRTDPYLARLNRHDVQFYDIDAGSVVTRPRPSVELPEDSAHAWSQIELLPEY